MFNFFSHVPMTLWINKNKYINNTTNNNDNNSNNENIAKVVHWKVCEKYHLEKKDKWYVITCDHVIEARRSDCVVVNRQERTCAIVDIALPGDIKGIDEKENEKVEKYQELKREIARTVDGGTYENCACR